MQLCCSVWERRLTAHHAVIGQRARFLSLALSGVLVQVLVGAALRGALVVEVGLVVAAHHGLQARRRAAEGGQRQRRPLRRQVRVRFVRVQVHGPAQAHQECAVCSVELAQCRPSSDLHRRRWECTSAHL